MTIGTQNYWNNKGELQVFCEALNKLVPEEGRVTNPVKNKALERFRVASNCYYDLFNNGGGNRYQQITKLFGRGIIRDLNYACKYGLSIESVFARTEPVMTAIIAAAAEEQNISMQLELF